jgi:hypothetical protein
LLISRPSWRGVDMETSSEPKQLALSSKMTQISWAPAKPFNRPSSGRPPGAGGKTAIRSSQRASFHSSTALKSDLGAREH